VAQDLRRGKLSKREAGSALAYVIITAFRTSSSRATSASPRELLAPRKALSPGERACDFVEQEKKEWASCCASVQFLPKICLGRREKQLELLSIS
jgi:hypothetical protein